MLRDRERPSGRLLWQGEMDASYVDLADARHLEFDYLRRMRDLVEAAGARRVVHVGGAGCADGRFLGLIPPYRMLAVLLAEHDRSLARLGGYAARGREARLAAEEPVRQRIRHRLPWLVVGLFGAMVSAVVVASFEEQLERNVLIAVFIPAVVYMADAVGTQTETVLIRAMTTGVSPRDVARREIGSGVAMGVLVASAFFLFALAAWGDASVATAVALALVASCSIASLVAMVLPTAIRHFGRDPAFGAGPLATVIQDLLSVIVYLALAAALVA